MNTLVNIYKNFLMWLGAKPPTPKEEWQIRHQFHVLLDIFLLLFACAACSLLVWSQKEKSFIETTTHLSPNGDCTVEACIDVSFGFFDEPQVFCLDSPCTLSTEPQTVATLAPIKSSTPEPVATPALKIELGSLPDCCTLSVATTLVLLLAFLLGFLLVSTNTYRLSRKLTKLKTELDVYVVKLERLTERINSRLL